MVNYRRNFVPGGTYFFTVTLADRRSTLLTNRIEAFREAYQTVSKNHTFQTIAVVVLPDHVHAVWNLPIDDTNYSTRWRLIKTRFTQTLGIASPWQRRFWEHTIRDERDLEHHVNYIHFNPVKHGLVARASDWPHSSIHRWIERGDLDPNWGWDSEASDQKTRSDDAFGEPSP